MHDGNPSHIDLQAIAKQVMQEHGFEPEFPPQASQQLAELEAHPPQVAARGNVRDLRVQLWSSIDNDTSRDLDQIELAERVSNGDVRVMIGSRTSIPLCRSRRPSINTPRCETTTVYTGVRNFPMLPEELSTGVTSLLENQDRLCIVIEFVVDASGQVTSQDIYRAVVRNKAQLQYNSVGEWLEGTLGGACQGCVIE